MCGIAGYIGTKAIDNNRLQSCLHLMHRRGPDANGLYHHEFAAQRHVYLLHTRLSIIDLDPRSNQPFHHRSKVIVYNGEVYNFLELKADLYKTGHSFNTTSDTEVLIHAIDEWGWQKALDRAEGMWAFALYDESDGSLMLSRDRFGEKPLYLYRDNTGLYFGSEVKFIVALLGIKLAINYNHLFRYLVNGYKALYKVNETFFIGIEELKSASLLHVNLQGNEEYLRYWAPTFTEDPTLTVQDAIQGIREALQNSMRLRLRADVPLAFCMSGGIDSSSLIGIAKKVFGYDVHGFTIMNEDDRYEERTQVETMVSELNLRHTPISISNEMFLENLKTLIHQHDAPIYTISYYLHWLMMKMIQDNGYRISISGTGADELLTGYYDHHNLYLYEIRDTPLYDSALQAWQEHIAPLVRNPYLKNPLLYRENPQFRKHNYLNNIEFSEHLTTSWGEDFKEKHYTNSLLRNRMLNELYHEAVPVILHEDDLNAMYYSIENRSPYLDRHLFEFCNQIPTRYLIDNGYTKTLLRKSMTGIVPDSILWNYRKVGFNASIFSFLNVKDPQTKSWLLDDSPIYQHVHKAKIESMIETKYLQNSASKFLFYFVCAKQFLEEFNRN